LKGCEVSYWSGFILRDPVILKYYKLDGKLNFWEEKLKEKNIKQLTPIFFLILSINHMER
jgi:hypothetical protein